MNRTIYQQINITNLRVNTVSNASVLQIGSAGVIRSLANVSNTGGFGTPAAAPPQRVSLPMQAPLSLVPFPAAANLYA